ncbi:MAG TPA: cupin domain-containing protein [Stellaceae bacterium]|jgi:quercetin dioxygenase-like cupin family protein|nr:cupin domain-containing protein [Stellaceae bacterium]
MIRAFAVAAAAALLLAVGADAQPAPAPKPIPTHIFLDHVPVSGVPNKTTTMVSVEWPPNASSGRHYHDGDEYGLVTEGVLRIIYFNGKPPLTVKAGEAYHNPAGLVHETRNASSSVTYSISVLVLDRGKPLTEPTK